eukprot:1151827-Pleurochrysis_carterae.AAC.1
MRNKLGRDSSDERETPELIPGLGRCRSGIGIGGGQIATAQEKNSGEKPREAFSSISLAIKSIATQQRWRVATSVQRPRIENACAD